MGRVPSRGHCHTPHSPGPVVSTQRTGLEKLRIITLQKPRWDTLKRLATRLLCTFLLKLDPSCFSIVTAHH